MATRHMVMALVSLGTVWGCSPSLSAPPTTLIECTSNAECPEDFTCGVSSGLCIPDSLNTPPALTVGVVPRGAAQLVVPVTLVDSENEDVTLDIDISFEGPAENRTWIPVDPSAIFPTPNALSSLSPGNVHSLTINLASNSVSSAAGLDVQNSLTGDGSTEQLQEVVTFVAEAYLRFTPTDASGNVGSPVESASFSVGNTPPVVSLTGWPDGSQFQRYVPVEYFLSDTAADPAQILVEFRVGPLDTFSAATIVAGLPDGGTVATTVDGEVRVAVWDTLPDLGLVTNSTPIVRVRATDSLDGSLSFLSPWAVLSTPPVSTTP